MARKGILLAGGKGTRLYPLTSTVNKHLLPVYDKPMIYYSLATLMLAGIQEVLIVTTPADVPHCRNLLGDGNDIGMKLSYAAQKRPDGIPSAMLLSAEFLGDDELALILGDNFFCGPSLERQLRAAAARSDATIFAHQVDDPGAYGVITFDHGRPSSIDEKPSHPRSNYAVTGLYFYGNDALQHAAQLSPSARGETEITDLNRFYLRNGALRVEVMEQGTSWLDMGTPESLLRTATLVHAADQSGRTKIGCVEEIAWRQGWIDDIQLRRLADRAGASKYGAYLGRQLRLQAIATLPVPA